MTFKLVNVSTFITALMSVASILIPSNTHAAAPAQLSGTVYSESTGETLPDAQVFIEQGLMYPIEMMRTDADGHYHFPTVLPTQINVFAYAEGYAFGGYSIRASAGDTHDNLSIFLKKAATISGHVVNHKKKNVSNSYISRVLLADGNVRDLATKKFSIPFTKIRKFGFQIPTTNSKGTFSINRLPIGETAFIKANHSKYAQQMEPSIKVGATNIKITLTPGVLVSGSVRSRGTNNAVPNAPVVFRNSLPPKDTVITRAAPDGVYLLRLRPGAYVYESIGSTYTNVAKPQVIVSGETATLKIDLIVAGKSTLNGKVLDAESGDPVVDAQIILKTDGAPYKNAQTNEKGEYTFAAPAGPVSIEFWGAGGYLPPPTPGFTLTLMPDQTETAPTFWLKAIPAYSLEIIDVNKAPVAGAIVQILHPKQIGWRTTDENGLVKITMAATPENGIVVGYVDHPTEQTGALFKIDATRATDAIVQLSPLRSIQGRVVNQQGKGLGNQIISCEIAHADLPPPVNIWSILTDHDGNFQYPGVVEGISLRYSTASPASPENTNPISVLFTATGDRPAQLPDLTNPDGVSSDSLMGKSFPWREFKSLKNSPTRSKPSDSTGTVVVFTKFDRAKILLDTLESIQASVSKTGIQFVLVIDGPTILSSKTIPLYRGAKLGTADVHLISSKGKIILETNGLSTYSAIRDTLTQP